MRNIYHLKKKYEKKYAKLRCNLDNRLECTKDFCKCSRYAEIDAYKESVVPRGYEKLDIFNFHGASNFNKKLLSNPVVIKAKNEISSYCWGKSWEGMNKEYKTNEEKKDFMRNNNVLPSRIFNSNNVVIYGDASRPLGRTLVASIIMNKVIELRIKPIYRSHTYDWIDYCVLFDELNPSKSSDLDNKNIDYLRGCDWLVIDNITISSSISHQQQHFQTTIFNPFILGRLSERLVTILVIKDNIENKNNSEEVFGLGINSVINSNSTTTIPLC